MYKHEPKDYRCPLCAIRDGLEGDFPHTKQVDIFHENDLFTAIVASHGWKTNKNHVVIFSNQHYENLYDIDERVLVEINRFSKKVALAMRGIYKCEGTTVRQNNEPAGDQDVWHYHLHVFPRYTGDKLFKSRKLIQLNDPKERAVFAQKLRDCFGKENKVNAKD